MDELILKPGNEDAGKRLDAYISENSELTRSFVSKLCEDNRVFCNDICKQKNYKIKPDDLITVNLPEPEITDIEPENIDIDIVYEDSDVVIVNKEQGMIVHPASGIYSGTLVNAILYHCGESLSGINGTVRPGIVHRIDKDTSGLLVIAKTNEAHLDLAEQWKTTKPDRKYIALVHGNIKDDSFTLNYPIGRSKNDRKKMAVVSGGREAITHVKVLERFSKYTLVECVLDTGRTHQIRVHMSYINHPIAGDKTYGIKKEEFSLNGQLLHARTLGFSHPVTKEHMVFSSELPGYFEGVLKKLRERM